MQENYINYRPSSIGKDDSGIKRMNSIARAAESIGDGDIINVQIRRYRQWQLSQTSALSSCIIPYVLFSSGLKLSRALQIIFILLCDIYVYIFCFISSALLHGQRETLEQVSIIMNVLDCGYNF